MERIAGLPVLTLRFFCLINSGHRHATAVDCDLLRIDTVLSLAILMRRNLSRYRDDLLHTMQQIYGHKMTAMSGGDLLV